MSNQTLVGILESQYKASLRMLRTVIEKTPDEELYASEYSNPSWQIAYHAIWGTQFYLGANAESFIPREEAIEGAESLGGTEEWENPDEGVVVDGQNTPEELLSFIDDIENGLRDALEELPLGEPSGFDWYPFSRFELHINSIRHIQHHTAQLIERLKLKSITGFPWATNGKPQQEW